MYLAADIGGTHVRVALYPEDGIRYIKHRRVSTSGKKPLLDRLISLIESILPKDGTVKMIGVAAPGPLDTNRGILFSPPNIPEWNELHLKEILEDRLQIPVYLGNDANMAAVGEWKYGAGRGHHHMVYLTISTGIGGGVIINDELLLGVHGLAGELGHVTVDPDGPVCSCGERGHLEAVASGSAIADFAAEQLRSGRQSSLSGLDIITAKDVADAASKGDVLANEIIQRVASFLGRAIAEYLHIFNPSVVILGGGVSNSGDLLLNPIREILPKYVFSNEYLRDLEIKLASLGDDAGLLGVLTIIRNRSRFDGNN